MNCFWRSVRNLIALREGKLAVDYTLVRSGRKSIAIQITRDAELVVRAPRKTPKAEIDRLLREKKDWIDKHMTRRGQLCAARRAFAPRYGDRLLFRGESYPIRAEAGNLAGFDENGFYLPENLDSQEIKDMIIRIYKALAKKVLSGKAAHYAGVMALYPTAVKINSAKTRWGSCSGKNSLNFSWRLVLAGDDIIDYVVVHELAHIAEHNHSDRFWRVVAGVMPDYKERRRGLAALQERLSAEDW